MTELEKVISVLSAYKNHSFGDKAEKVTVDDIIALLKTQEPVKPIPDTSYGARPWWFVCGNCRLSVNEDQKYCPNCGRKVKWK